MRNKGKVEVVLEMNHAFVVLALFNALVNLLYTRAW
jgi:hypothetical protein